jgi:ABC-type glycerol-3-phosphate transport system substrate-binding protein
MKKQAVFLLSAFLILAAGCAKADDKTASSPPSSPNGTTLKPTDTSKVTEISFVTHSNWEKPIKKVIEAFEKENPTIKIKAEFNPYAKLTETNEVKLSAKSQDLDVVTVDVPLTANYTVKGYLEPLDSLLGSDALKKWTPTALEAGSFKGQLMSAPLNSSGVVLFYNKDIFQKNNIPFLSDNVKDRLTWEQVVDTAKKLTSDGIYGFSFDQIGRAYQLLPLLNSKGVQALGENGLVSTGFTNSPQAISGLQFYYDLFNTSKVSPKIKREESPDYFTTGKVAMFLSNTANLPKIVASGVNFGVAPHPYFQGGKVSTPTGSLHLGISKFSTKKEAAAQFVKYIHLCSPTRRFGARFESRCCSMYSLTRLL